MTFVIDKINYGNLDKNYTFFSDIYFCMDIMMEMVREDFLTLFLEVLDQARGIE